MSKTHAVRQYLDGAKADFTAIAQATVQPVSRKATIGMAIIAAISALIMNAYAVMAATPLFERLTSGINTLLTDAQDMVVTIATFALVICVIGIFIASMLGPKATATMTSALKMVIGFFIFWQLVPVVLSTMEQVFGSGGTGGN